MHDIQFLRCNKKMMWCDYLQCLLRDIGWQPATEIQRACITNCVPEVNK